mgnify:CR=1 FL=1
MLKNGIIFGKFYPLHIGHVDFIQQASGFVKNLYVVVCSDVDRDKELVEESRMKKMPTIKDRLRFVEKTFKHQKNIKIIHLAEDGIPFYPNGWKLWSERVQETLLKNNIKVDVIFTNETQDIQNYKDNFLTLPNFEKTFDKNLEIKVIDVKRNNFHISATEIRKNPYKNWFFIPKYVREFFILKVGIIGSEHSGKTNLTHKLANYYNTTYVKEYRKEYIREILQNNEDNLQYEDYSQIAYGQNQKISEAVKNADRLIIVDTEFTSLQSYYLKNNESVHPVIEDFIRNSSFDVLIYIEKINQKGIFDGILQKLLQQTNKKYITLIHENNTSLTKNYTKSIEIIDNYINQKIV